MRDSDRRVPRGRAVIGVCGAPFKCPPAPSECALMLHDHLAARASATPARSRSSLPFMTPVPPSPDTSAALIEAFAERDIRLVPSAQVVSVSTATAASPARRRHRAPVRPLPRRPEAPRARCRARQRAHPRRLRPGRPAHAGHAGPGVYAIGDVATQGRRRPACSRRAPPAAVAPSLIAQVRGAGEARRTHRHGLLLHRVRRGPVGRVDVDFLCGPKPTGTFVAPSEELRG